MLKLPRKNQGRSGCPTRLFLGALVLSGWVFSGHSAMAQMASPAAHTPASVPYMPSAMARHHLQLLADHAGLPLPTTHWPLPAAAVQQALENLPANTAHSASREVVLQELKTLLGRAHIGLHLRAEGDGPVGFAENYTPGSSARITTAEGRWRAGAISLAGRLGGRAEANPNSLQNQFNGTADEPRYGFVPEDSAAVISWGGWNVQAFSQRHFWGPGWQSSLVNGSNNPAWTGLGVQRASAAPSSSPWLAWMGPWNLDVFVAQAQDPLVVPQQPSGFLFSGMRLTLKPQPWLEVGLSRGLQAGGAGRPGGIKNFAKAFLGQEVNQEIGDPVDTSAQIAGYDVRANCPAAWVRCAAYTQWMGEDAAGKTIPLPFKFMSLWGLETTTADGQHRLFAEWLDTNAYSLPWDTKPTFPGYVNGVYSQGYTQGTRWVGSGWGSGAQVLTLGWLDANQQRLIKLHSGQLTSTLGAYSPQVRSAPTGRLLGLNAQQTLRWHSLSLTPELAYTRLSKGQDQRAQHREQWRLGLSITRPL